MKVKKVIKIFLCMSLLFILSSCGNKEEENLNYTTSEVDGKTIYTIKTKKYVSSDKETNLVMIDVRDYGIMVAELYPDKAPITVENFKNLVSKNFYSGLIFHRVMKNFVIQTGDPQGNGIGGSDKTIKGEFEANGVKNDISHVRGVLSMARKKGSNPETSETFNSASSQFYIVQDDATYLDGKYAGFGKLVSGYDVLDKIASVETNMNDKPINDVVIKNVRFVEYYEG
ncbi:MAG: peptidylprolyl isomerase [Tenericutes bacterium]|nr:peptidylprolyl isomerase [Mycoplasmatota bacterium]